jgi:hypothetical protein
MTFMVIICGGFGCIAIVGYLSLIVELSLLDGRCRIGVPTKVSFPLLGFDVGLNFLLTGLFLWLLRPMLSHHGLLSFKGWFGARIAKKLRFGAGRGSAVQYSDVQRQAMNKNIKILLWKCLIGSTLVMLPTVGNMAQFYVMNGGELAWICLTICTLDGKFLNGILSALTQLTFPTVSWGVLIINWLTIGSAQAEKNLTFLMSQQTVSGRNRAVPLISTPSPGGSMLELAHPAVLRDAGKLLDVDKSVTPVRRLESVSLCV